MASRAAPPCGYDVGVKRQQRRWATSQILQNLPPAHRREVRYLCMPSLEGDEVDVIKGHGIPETRIIAWDRKPEVVATLRRRFPRIITAGCEINRLPDNLTRKGVRSIEAANLDFTGPLRARRICEVGDFLNRVVELFAVVAVTAKKGSPGGDITSDMRRAGESVDLKRLSEYFGRPVDRTIGDRGIALSLGITRRSGVDEQGCPNLVAHWVSFMEWTTWRSPMVAFVVRVFRASAALRLLRECRERVVAGEMQAADHGDCLLALTAWKDGRQWTEVDPLRRRWREFCQHSLGPEGVTTA